MTTERDLTRLELLDEIERIEDEYQEVARALGCTSFFHKDVLAVAERRGCGRDWRDEYKALEISWHQLKDEYSEIARALGFDGDSFWGDPLVNHQDVLVRAKAGRAAYDGLYRRNEMDV